MDDLATHRIKFSSTLRLIYKKEHKLLKHVPHKYKQRARTSLICDWKNPDEVREFNKRKSTTKVLCDCGKYYCYSGKTQHILTKFHKTFEFLKQSK